MAVRTEKSIVYHIPKCGGKWVKRVMRRAGLEYRRCRGYYRRQDWGLYGEHATPENVQAEEDDLFSFCFVREPVGWYRSFWSFRMKGLEAGGSLSPRFPADESWSDDPETFAYNLMGAFPGGFVTELYQLYVGAMDYVGRLENLRDDLETALTLAGETFDTKVLAETGPCNIVASRPEWEKRCELGPEVQERIRKVEGWVMETFYV